MELSVIIVSWNTRDVLEECLRSVVYSLQKAVDYEITVVDNASADGSADMVREKFPSVNLIENHDNIGYVRANNQAGALAKGKYLLLLNSDTKMIDDGARAIIDYMETNAKTAIVTGKVLGDDGRFQPPYRRFPGLLTLIVQHTFRRIVGLNTPFQKRFQYDDLNPELPHSVDWITGAYLYIRHDFLERGRIFDEDIFMYYEDTLLCKRAREAGFEVVYLPLAPIVHYRGTSARKARTATLLHSFQSSVVYCERLYGSVVAAIYRRAVKTIWWLTSLIFRLAPFGRLRRKADLFRDLNEQDHRARISSSDVSPF